MDLAHSPARARMTGQRGYWPSALSLVGSATSVMIEACLRTTTELNSPPPSNLPGFCDAVCVPHSSRACLVSLHQHPGVFLTHTPSKLPLLPPPVHLDAGAAHVPGILRPHHPGLPADVDRLRHPALLNHGAVRGALHHATPAKQQQQQQC
jgi:hypothetical protein